MNFSQDGTQKKRKQGKKAVSQGWYFWEWGHCVLG
jgi:hypothetical protein